MKKLRKRLIVLQVTGENYSYEMGENEVNISKLNHQTLSLQNAIALQTKPKSDSLQKVAEQMKDYVKAQPTPTFDKSESAGKLTIIEGTHFQFVHEMEGLSTDEKRRISQLIGQSVKQPAGGTGSYFMMDRAQSTAQLQLIADKLIPEKYKEQMNEAIQSYQAEGYNFQLKIYEAAQANMDNLAKQYPSIGKQNILADGMQRLQEQEKRMTGYYAELDFFSQSSFVQSFETVLSKFKDGELQQKSSPETVLNQYQDELRAKWNDFASLFNDSAIFKLSTAEHAVFDVWA